MTVLAAQHIRELSRPYKRYKGHGDFDEEDGMITPFIERDVVRGRSFGLSSAGYDIRVKSFRLDTGQIVETIRLDSGGFVLASSLERIKMPNDLIAIVHDKSSWAREGLCVQNTVLEPGWEGWITLELSFHRQRRCTVVQSGDPIAQLIFHRLSDRTIQPYEGKYQNQEDIPIEAIMEK